MEVLIIGLTTWIVIPMLVLIILLNVDKGEEDD
jgi:hypothetical protein